MRAASSMRLCKGCLGAWILSDHHLCARYRERNEHSCSRVERKDEGDFGNLCWANRPGRTGANFGPKGRWSLDFNGLECPTPSFPDWVLERIEDNHDQLALEILSVT